MAVRAVVFDIGGVLEVPTDHDLDDRWERRLGLRPGEFFQRLRGSGLGRDANLGRVSEVEFARALGQLYGLDRATTKELITDLWGWYLGELNTEMADYFQRLRPQYRTAILSNAAAGGRREEDRRYGFAAMADVLVYSYEVGIEKPDQRIYEITCERLSATRARWCSWTTWRSTWLPPDRSGCARFCSRAQPKRSPRWKPAWWTLRTEPPESASRQMTCWYAPPGRLHLQPTGHR